MSWASILNTKPVAAPPLSFVGLVVVVAKPVAALLLSSVHPAVVVEIYVTAAHEVFDIIFAPEVDPVSNPLSPVFAVAHIAIV